MGYKTSRRLEKAASIFGRDRGREVVIKQGMSSHGAMGGAHRPRGGVGGRGRPNGGGRGGNATAAAAIKGTSLDRANPNPPSSLKLLPKQCTLRVTLDGCKIGHGRTDGDFFLSANLHFGHHARALVAQSSEENREFPSDRNCNREFFIQLIQRRYLIHLDTFYLTNVPKNLLCAIIINLKLM